MTPIINQLRTACPDLNFSLNESLALHTTVGIGGQAEYFCQAESRQQLIQVVSAARKLGIPITVLGWGANTLVADRGIAGLTIKNKSRGYERLEDHDSRPRAQSSQPQPRWAKNKIDSQVQYEFEDLDYTEAHLPTSVVELDSGLPVTAALQLMLNQGLTGLQWYARIPATLGGAVVNNIHGGTHFLSELIDSVVVLDDRGQISELPYTELALGYDTSRFHHTSEVILGVRLRLYQGDVDRAQQVALTWAKRKQLQPQKSLGCIFQNLDSVQQESLQLPTPSIGYLIEHRLKLSGAQRGDARISTSHAAFIENVGQASAADYLALIALITSQAKTKFGLSLRPEIFFKGFTPAELEGIMEN